MEPLIHAKGSHNGQHDSHVLYIKKYNSTSLQPGNLVYVNITTPFGHYNIIRMVEQHNDTPSGYYYIISSNHNGFDSKAFGPVPASDILGKVIFIF